MEEEHEISRRGFLKAAAAVGAALTIQPTINKVKAANAVLNGQDAAAVKKDEMQYRTLGTGRAAMKMSALGFGVMVMNYNRSQSSDRKKCIHIIHEAMDWGVALFDTALIGGCINEYTVFDANNNNRQTLPRFQPEAIRANTRIVNVLQQFGRTRGMTSAQVALGWLFQKAPWIVLIPGTTKLSHLEENLHLPAEEWKELEDAVAAVGSRYNAEQQRQVGQYVTK